MSNPPAHQRFRYRLPAEHEGGFVAELWSRGMVGAQVRDAAPGHLEKIALDAYFPNEAQPAAADPGSAWARSGVELVAVETLDDQDWLAPWRAAAQPFHVGRRFLLDPREPEPSTAEGAAGAAPGDRILLRLPARAAFGTGSHESTRLALKLLEPVQIAGRSVLDVGTGTGVLAFAALALGARAAAACDVDPVAAFHAGENRRLNRGVLAGAGPAIWAGGLAALAAGARFDLVLANVLPERILPELARLTATVARGGALIYSGLLAEHEAEIVAAFAARGLAARARLADDEWVALRLEPE